MVTFAFAQYYFNCASSEPEHRSPVLLSAPRGGAQGGMVGLPVSESWWQPAVRDGAVLPSRLAR